MAGNMLKCFCMLRHLNFFSSCSRNRRARAEELGVSLRLPALTVTSTQHPPALDELDSQAVQPLAGNEEMNSHHYEDVLEAEVYEVPNAGLYINQTDMSTPNNSADYSGYVPMERRRE